MNSQACSRNFSQTKLWILNISSIQNRDCSLPWSMYKLHRREIIGVQHMHVCVPTCDSNPHICNDKASRLWGCPTDSTVLLPQPTTFTQYIYHPNGTKAAQPDPGYSLQQTLNIQSTLQPKPALVLDSTKILYWLSSNIIHYTWWLKFPSLHNLSPWLHVLKNLSNEKRQKFFT